MHDLNDLRIFERVVALRGFSAAAKALALPKSTVSRAVSRLEVQLRVRLINRTTRGFALTAAGESLASRCEAPLLDLSSAVNYVSGLSESPQGILRISCGVGWSYHILADQLPAFIKAFPSVNLQIDATSKITDLISDRIDVAIRMGPIPDSSIVSVRLGAMSRLLCAAPAYFKECAAPRVPQDLGTHQIFEMPGADGRPRMLTLKRGSRGVEVKVQPRIETNDPLAIYRLVKGGAGIGVVSNYLCAQDIRSGALLRVLPEWSCPAVDVSLVFPSKKELSPNVRAFVDFMKAANGPKAAWRDQRTAQS